MSCPRCSLAQNRRSLAHPRPLATQASLSPTCATSARLPRRWASCRRGQKLLAPGGFLAIYGPFKDKDGRFTTESNRAFDERLRSQDQTWGYRSVAQLDALCAEAGLQLVSRRDMPANNNMLTYVKSQ